MFILSVISKQSHLQRVPLIETHLMGQDILYLVQLSLCRPSHLLQPLLSMVTRQRNGELASHMAHSSAQPLDHSLPLSLVQTQRKIMSERVSRRIRLHINLIAGWCIHFHYYCCMFVGEPCESVIVVPFLFFIF